MASPLTIDTSATSNGVVSDIGLATWNTARTDDPAKEVSSFITASVSTGNYQCGRYFGFFDMSGIPAGSTITAAKIVHPVISNYTNTAGGAVHIVEHVATDPISIADFLLYKSLDSDVSFGNVNYSGLSQVTTTDITINATGITYLASVIGGTAKLGLRSSFDINNSAPVGDSQYTCSVTGFDLVVTYTEPSTSGFFAIL